MYIHIPMYIVHTYVCKYLSTCIKLLFKDTFWMNKLFLALGFSSVLMIFIFRPEVSFLLGLHNIDYICERNLK